MAREILNKYRLGIINLVRVNEGLTRKTLFAMLEKDPKKWIGYRSALHWAMTEGYIVEEGDTLSRTPSIEEIVWRE